MMLRKKIGSIVAASLLAAGLVVGTTIPASAASSTTINLADTAAIQDATRDMSIVDSAGKTWWITVTTSWQRQSSTKGVLRTIILRPKTFPRNECLSISVGSTSNINYSSSPRTLCGSGNFDVHADENHDCECGIDELGSALVPDARPLGATQWRLEDDHDSVQLLVASRHACLGSVHI